MLQKPESIDYSDFEAVKDHYSRKNKLCENRLGKYYDFKYNRIYDVGCGKWDCRKCRPRLKFDLYLDILINTYSFELDKHFVITFKGKDFRDKISWSDSYRFMNDNWVKFRKCIEYHKGFFDYILLPRSQRSGYCHFHILLNKRISWNFLNKARKNYDFGYLSIQKNKEVAEYLHGDFFKDSEYMIPKNIRHYRSSRSIKLLQYKKEKIYDSDNMYFTHETSFKKMEDLVYHEYCRHLPFEEYFKQYYQNFNKPRKYYDSQLME